MKTKVYALRGDNRFVRYVGKTKHSLPARLQGHLDGARKGENTYKGRWIRSMLNRGLVPTITLLGEYEGDGSKEEIAWIKFFQDGGVKLTNGTDGGDGGDTWSRSEKKEDIKKKLSLISKTCWNNPIYRENQTRKKKGIPWSNKRHVANTPEVLKVMGQKISRTLKGRKKPCRSMKHRLHLSIAKQGVKWKQDTYRKVHQTCMNKRSYKVTYCEECGKPIRQLVQNRKRFCNTSCSAKWRGKQPNFRKKISLARKGKSWTEARRNAQQSQKK